MKRKLILKNMSCANCALKLEKKINEIDDTKNVSLNFTTQKLQYDYEDEKTHELVIKAIDSMNEGIIIKEEHEEHEHSEFNKNKKIRLIIGFLLFIIGIIIKQNQTIEFIIFFIAYLLVGGDVLLKSIKNILKGEIFDENFLMSIATIGAFVLKEYAEGVAVMLFYQIGEFFQDLAVERSRKSITELMDIRPDYANLLDGTKVKPEEVKINDLIIVKAGERIPLDGQIIEGFATLDTSSLTGESLPQEVQKKDIVLSGTINLNGLLTIKVSKLYEDSTVSKILDLVENASSKKSKTENFITKFAAVYTPIIVFLAVLITIIPTMFFNGEFSDWLNRSLIFLVISCPCALVISIPLGFFGGIGGASRNGILIKGGNYLEALNNVETIVFDKTGTLTKGVFKVTKIYTFNDYLESDVLKYAAIAENHSNHPIAISIKKEYNQEIKEVSNYEEIPGHGIKVKFENEEIIVGNKKMMDLENIENQNINEIGTLVYVSINKVLSGIIVISDEIKKDSIKTIRELKRIGIKNIVMLTGDNELIANKVAKELNINVISELLPHQKVSEVEKLMKNKKGNLIFVGDGINDAPVLAMADIGVSMGVLGSDAAIEAADVVLMTDEPYKLVNALEIAKYTKKIVYQNIGFAMSVKILVLILGAGGLATMWEAVFADVGVALLAILNATRVIKYKQKDK